MRPTNIGIGIILLVTATAGLAAACQPLVPVECADPAGAGAYAAGASVGGGAWCSAGSWHGDGYETATSHRAMSAGSWSALGGHKATVTEHDSSSAGEHDGGRGEYRHLGLAGDFRGGDDHAYLGIGTGAWRSSQEFEDGWYEGEGRYATFHYADSAGRGAHGHATLAGSEGRHGDHAYSACDLTVGVGSRAHASSVPGAVCRLA